MYIDEDREDEDEDATLSFVSFSKKDDALVAISVGIHGHKTCSVLLDTLVFSSFFQMVTFKSSDPIEAICISYTFQRCEVN